MVANPSYMSGIAQSLAAKSPTTPSVPSAPTAPAKVAYAQQNYNMDGAPQQEWLNQGNLASYFSPEQLSSAGYTGSAPSYTADVMGNKSLTPDFQNWLTSKDYRLEGAAQEGESNYTGYITDSAGTPVGSSNYSDSGGFFQYLPALGSAAVLGAGAFGPLGPDQIAALGPSQVGALSAAPEAGAISADMLPSIGSVVGSEAALPGLAGGTVGSEALASGTALGGGIASAGSGLLTAAKNNPQLAAAIAGAGVTALNQPGAAPSGTSPTDTIKAQTDATTQAALLQAALNRVNTVGPTGSTTYSSTANPNTPGGFDYTQTTALSPEQQKIFDANQASTLKQSQLLDALTGTVGKGLQNPMDFSAVPGLKTSAGDPAEYYQQAADAAYDRQKQYLDPQVKQQQDALEARLAEQGFVPGTPGYNQAMQNFMDTNNRSYAAARDSAIQQGVSAGQGIFSGNLSNAQLNNNASGQTLAQLLQQRNQPLNELNAVKTGTQVQLPNAPAIAQVQTPATNVAGITNQAYQNQLGVYNANVGSTNATNQSISQLLAALGTTYSDARLKSGIIPIGRTPGGVNVYEYIIGGEKQIGVIAQEILLTQPEAVLLNPENGFLMVNYRKVR